MVRRAENTLKCKDFRAEGQTLRGGENRTGRNMHLELCVLRYM